MRERGIVPHGLAAVLLAVAGGCGGATQSPSLTRPPVSPTPSVEEAATATPAPTATPTAAPPTTAPTPAGPFASAIYPYTLELPASVQNRGWTPAVVAWDGAARIATNSLAIDTTGTVDGTLMIWGLPSDGDLASFMDLVGDNAARFHGCTEVGDQLEFEVNGVAALGQHENCALDTKALRTVLLKDGYAIAVRVIVNPDKVDVVFDNVVGWLDGLAWLTP